jgi:ubiquinol-cytochrome c reductase iron-sulfur subunit
VTRLRDWLLAGIVLLVGRGRPSPPPRRRMVGEAPPSPGAEALVLLLLALASLCAAGFVALYALSLSHETQWLGLSLGGACVFIAAALVVTSHRLVVAEELEEDYPPAAHPEDQERVEQILDEGGDRLTRRRLFKLGLLGAGGTLGLALLTPAASLGPLFHIKDFLGTPWRRGRRLVDENGRPWRADDIEENDFYTAFAEGADMEELGSPLVLVRLPKEALRLPAHLRGYDAGGIVAYSKICTHAGCAIAMYRAPLYRPAEPSRALVCPCHYSTFDPASGGTVIYGPAGRPLPMLPIAVDASGHLRATGNFDEQVGPSWWGSRIWRPNP